MIDLVLLCGLLSDETVWSEVAGRLAGVARVHIVSFPNFSSIEAMARHVLETGPRRFALAGHSMGGRVALEVWRQAPDRIIGLALLNTGSGPRGANESVTRGRLVQLARERGMAAVAGDWLPPMLGAPTAQRAKVAARLVAMVERQTPDSFAAQQQALLARPDADPVLPTIRVPTLLVSGSADAWSPIAQHEAMRRRIPDATLVAIEDAGHMAPTEQPDAVASALGVWLAGL